MSPDSNSCRFKTTLIKRLIKESTLLLEYLCRFKGLNRYPVPEVVSGWHQRGAKGQELLSRMNPTMSATGDPIMILFPAVIGGLLANFETSFYPPVQNEDQNKKKKEQEKTERAAISVNLPGLGEVSVEISIKKNQPEVIFKVETDEIYEFMRSQLNSFAKRLATDFEDSKVIIETKPKVEVVPEWLQTLVQDAAVVA